MQRRLRLRRKLQQLQGRLPLSNSVREGARVKALARAPFVNQEFV